MWKALVSVVPSIIAFVSIAAASVAEEFILQQTLCISSQVQSLPAVLDPQDLCHEHISLSKVHPLSLELQPPLQAAFPLQRMG